jgi:hypothetical protein
MTSCRRAFRRGSAPEDNTARSQALHATVKGWYGHSVISRVVPSHVGMTYHATAAQLLGKGVCGPLWQPLERFISHLSADHHDLSCAEPGTPVLRHRQC